MAVKSWFIVGYSQKGATYCRSCVAETLKDDEFADPYCNTEHDDFTPMFLSDVNATDLSDMYCEWCLDDLSPLHTSF